MEFALSPSSTFGLQMLALRHQLHGPSGGSEWPSVFVRVRVMKQGQDKAAPMLPHLEPLIKRGPTQGQSKLGSSV